MINPLKMNMIRKLMGCLISIILFLSSVSSFATDDIAGEEMAASDGTVEVEYLPQVTLPYRERRPSWALAMSVGQEVITPDSFVSIQDNSSYETLYGSGAIHMVQATLGFKYNIPMGAVSAEGIFATGNVADDRTGSSRSLSLTKKGVQATWTLDAIFKEPLVAPYVSGQIFELDYNDKGASTGNSAGTTAPTSSIVLGLLLQLNSLDPTDTAMVAHHDFGLNNTYLDLFVSQYNSSTSSSDPEFQTAVNWGAGLRLEF